MAKFSKAHYVILAKVIKETNLLFINQENWYGFFLDALKQNLAYKFEQDNPKFDKQRFLDESEVKR
jgi:hypothetical protein